MSKINPSKLKRTQTQEPKRQEIAPVFARFCEVIEGGASHKAALMAVGLNWRDVSNVALLDPYMKEQYDNAIRVRDQQWRQAVADECHRRGVVGTEEPIVREGRVVGQRKVYSDRLLELLYRAHHPEHFVTRVDANVNSTSRTITELVIELERRTPIGATRPCVFVSDPDPQLLNEAQPSTFEKIRSPRAIVT